MNRRRQRVRRAADANIRPLSTPSANNTYQASRWPDDCAEAMEAITRIVTFTGTRVASFKHFERRLWKEMDAGRNAVVS